MTFGDIRCFYHLSKHEEEPEVLTAVLDIVADVTEEADDVPDDGLHPSVGPGGGGARETLLKEPGEVGPHVPGGALHQEGPDVLEAVLRGQKLEQPDGGRGTLCDDGVDGLNPVCQIRPAKQEEDANAIPCYSMNFNNPSLHP